MANAETGRIRFDRDIRNTFAPPILLPLNASMVVSRQTEIHPGFTHDALPILADAFNDRQWDAELVGGKVTTPSTCLILLTANHAVDGTIGFVTVHSTPDTHVGKLHWLAVVPKWRGNQIGQFLVSESCRLAHYEFGYQTMTLTTETYRREAVSLYKKLGFTHVA